MKAKDIMTKDVAFISPSTTVSEAAQLMQKYNVGSIPVMDATGVVGILTDRDIVVRNIAPEKDSQNTPVSDIMTSQVTTITPDTEISEVSSIMSGKQIRRIPVVENNKLVGILALGDIATSPRYDTEASSALTEISKPSRPEKCS